MDLYSFATRFTTEGNTSVEHAMKGVGAHADALTGKLTQSSAATLRLGEHIEGIGSIVERVKIPLAGFIALLAGGEIFERVVERTVAMAEALNVLSQKTGVETQELQKLRYVANLSDVAVESLDVGLKKLALSIQSAQVGTGKGAEAFKALNIDVSTAAMKHKTMGDVLIEVSERFARFKDGAGKAALAMNLFGRSGTDLIPLLNQGPEKIREMAAESEKLGGILNAQQQGALLLYEDRMKQFKFALSGVSNVIAAEVVPSLTSMAEKAADVLPKLSRWMQDAAPYAHALSDALLGIAVALLAIKTQALALQAVAGVQGLFFMTGAAAAFKIAAMEGTGFVGTLQNLKYTVAPAAATVAVLAGAVALLAAYWKDAKEEMDLYDRELKEQGDTSAALQAIRYRRAHGLDAARERYGNVYKKPTKKSDAPNVDVAGTKTEMQKLEEAWLDQKERLGAFRAQQTAAELQYWESVIKTAKLKGDEQLGVHRKIVALRQTMTRDAFAEELAVFKEREEAAKNDATARLAIMAEEGARIKDVHGEQSKEYAEWRRRMDAAQREALTKSTQLQVLRENAERDHQTALLDIESEAIKQQLALGDIKAVEALKQERALQEKVYQIKLAAAQADVVAEQAGGDPEKIAKAQAKVRALTDAHNLELKKSNNAITLAIKGQWVDVFDNVTNAVQSSVEAIINGTQTMAGALRNIFRSILLEYISSKAKEVAVHAAAELAKKGITIQGALTTIAARAWEAAASAYASIAAIPVVGPYLAPVVAAGALAAVLSFGGALGGGGGGGGGISTGGVPTATNTTTNVGVATGSLNGAGYHAAPKQPINVTIIGPNDPTAQRQIKELIANADRRG